MSEIKKFVSKNGYYKIPVEWTVSATITVRDVANLEEALEKVKSLEADIPLNRNAEYIDGTYKIVEEDESLFNAQDYIRISDILVDKDGIHEI